MRLRCLYSLFTVFAIVMASGCCCCHHWGEHRACRRSYHQGTAGCDSCSTSNYTPCDCGGPAGPALIAPTPIPGPMPKATTMIMSR